MHPTPIVVRLLAVLALLAGVAAPVARADEPESPNVGHTRHHHPRNAPHPKAPDPSRFVTSRSSEITLPLPEEKNAFSFVVFGDRTSGIPTGVSVLADAVRDVNLIEPDMVLTVGDLIQGYNQQDKWMEEMQEYKAIMGRLICPWFPVAGNHDVYWRGPRGVEVPQGQHEKNYETHFGPLWYAFKHKNSWFIVLYSDEGDPATNRKGINEPALQRMSDEQFTWLKETLVKAKGADHVFLFLHHPRWIGGNYGDDWDKVHKALVDAGNVTAVFAGHIHRMRYDGPKDGIEYFTLATTGGNNQGTVPEAGFLHHYHVVTVRKQQVAVAAFPVGQAMDVRELTNDLISQTEKLAELAPKFAAALPMDSTGAVAQSLTVEIANPTDRAIDVTLFPDSKDSRWLFRPDHDHAMIEPGQSKTMTFRVNRPAGSIDSALRLPELVTEIDYLAPATRYTIPPTRTPLPMLVDVNAPATPADEAALDLAGGGSWITVPNSQLDLPAAGPLTAEAWVRPRKLEGRRAVLVKGSGEIALGTRDGTPAFSVLTGRRATVVTAEDLKLSPDKWTHLAGVYDGSTLSLYVDGLRVASRSVADPRTSTGAALLVGAAPGRARGHDAAKIADVFEGQVDAVRLSTVARYSGTTFTPERRFKPDSDTRLLLNMDALVGPWAFDESPRKAHGVISGQAIIEPAAK